MPGGDIIKPGLFNFLLVSIFKNNGRETKALDRINWNKIPIELRSDGIQQRYNRLSNG